MLPCQVRLSAASSIAMSIAVIVLTVLGLIDLYPARLCRHVHILMHVVGVSGNTD
jgi:hypothetical protein